MSLLKILNQYNRKERNYVVNYCLGKGIEGLSLHPSFVLQLENVIGSKIDIFSDKNNYFAALEYNFDWIYASLYEYTKNNPINPCSRTKKSDFIRGTNNADIDLLIVHYDENIKKYNFYLIEAKYDNNWEETQIKNKLSKLNSLFDSLFGGTLSDFINKIYFVFYSNHDSDNKKILNEVRQNSFCNFIEFYGMDIRLPDYGDSLLDKFRRNLNIETSIFVEHIIFGGFNFNKISQEFEDKLKSLFNISLNNYFVSIDYPFKNIFKSLDIKSNISDRTDIDLLLVNQNANDFYDFIFLEAKVYTSWDKKQLGKKLDYINEIIKENKLKANYYFLLFDKDERVKRYYEDVCEYLNIPNDNIQKIIIDCSSKYKVQRCDENGKQSRGGEYWIKRLS